MRSSTSLLTTTLTQTKSGRRNNETIVCFFGIVAVALVFATETASAQFYTSGQFYKIINKASSKALDVSGSKADNGVQIIQWDFKKSNNQLWEFVRVGNFYQIVNKATGKCLDVEGAKPNNGARIIQWESNKGNNQLWEFQRDEKGFYRIISKATSKALTVEDNAVENGARIVQWEVNDGNNQLWEIEAVY